MTIYCRKTWNHVIWAGFLQLYSFIEAMHKRTFTATTLYNHLDQIHHGWNSISIVVFNPVINYNLTKSMLDDEHNYQALSDYVIDTITSFIFGRNRHTDGILKIFTWIVQHWYLISTHLDLGVRRWVHSSPYTYIFVSVRWFLSRSV